MREDQDIWRLKQGIGDCDDWGIVVWHGELGPDGTVYRYGSPVPAVTFPSSHLMVSGAVRNELMSAVVDWVRVANLCITDPATDWCDWGDRINERAACLTRTLDAEEPEDIVVPPFESRRPMRVVADPDYWLVRPRVKLAWSPEQKAPIRPSNALGFYQHPVLPYPVICVDDRVLKVLLAAGDPAMIEAVSIKTAAED